VRWLAVVSLAVAASTARVGALQVTYPASFSHLSMPRGVVIADYPLTKNSPTLRAAIFPSSGVVVELVREPKLQPPVPAAAGRFPLALAKLGPSDSQSNGRTWELRFAAKGSVYWLVVWFGKTSSRTDRAAAASIVASIRP
jgi:hypothetical protein